MTKRNLNPNRNLLSCATPLIIGLTLSLLSACDFRGVPDSHAKGEDLSFLSEPLKERPENNTCLAFEKPQLDTAVKLDRLTNHDFSEIIGFQEHPIVKKRFYAVGRTGKIHTFTEGGEKNLFLDVASLINSKPGEGGLLGMAWHPTKKNEFYLSYTATSGSSPANLKSVVARFRANDEMSGILKPEVLIELDKPFENHNGGYISFGNDGHLYIGFGDGGSGGDPKNNGQKLDTLAGKILRIDINKAEGYAIPSDNPFVGKAGVLPEIYAYGLRNPWRFQFDRETGDLWAADVGQDRFEEVNKISSGGNYGWKVKEGFECFQGNPGCGKVDTIDPVITYGRDQGVSITGGFVYRGKKIPSLRGIYVYGDFVSGNIWGLFQDDNGRPVQRLLLNTGFNIPAFGQDSEGEIYVLEYGRGLVHALNPKSNGGPAITAPKKLSETGCFQKSDIKTPAKGLVPYTVNSPLWSDAAAKRRWMALPNGQTITVAKDGRFQFPNGSMLVKEFALGEKIIETRLMAKHKDGSWGMYTYAWNDEQSDAVLVEGGLTKRFGELTWQYPSNAQCFQCHTANTGFALGLEVSQLNGRVGREESSWIQLDNLREIGLFSNASIQESVELPTPGDRASPESSARAYLHANCSFCHRPGGTGGGNLDMRFETDLKATGLCNVPGSGNLGIKDARVIYPGSPEKSVLFQRINRRGAQQMPPLASNLVDVKAKDFIEEWITTLEDCPMSKPLPPATNELRPGEVVSFVSRHSDKCIDLDNGNFDNGGRVHQWQCDGGDNQRFRVEEVIENVFRLRNVKSNKCLEIGGGNSANDAFIQQWDCNGGLHQQLRVKKTTDEAMALLFMHSGKCVDVQAWSVENRARFVQWECTGGANQDWIVRRF